MGPFELLSLQVRALTREPSLREHLSPFVTKKHTKTISQSDQYRARKKTGGSSSWDIGFRKARETGPILHVLSNSRVGCTAMPFFIAYHFFAEAGDGVGVFISSTTAAGPPGLGLP